MLTHPKNDEALDAEAYVGAARKRLWDRLREATASSLTTRALTDAERSAIDDLVFVIIRLSDREAIMREIRAIAAKHAGIALGVQRLTSPRR